MGQRRRLLGLSASPERSPSSRIRLGVSSPERGDIHLSTRVGQRSLNVRWNGKAPKEDLELQQRGAAEHCLVVQGPIPMQGDDQTDMQRLSHNDAVTSRLVRPQGMPR